jgi:hypothetical protein
LVRSRNNAKADQIGESSTYFRREIVVLDQDGSCRWTLASPFIQETAICAKAQCNVMRVRKILIRELLPIHNNSMATKALVVSTIKHIRDLPRL